MVSPVAECYFFLVGDGVLSLQAAATVIVIVITMVASFLILLPAFMFMTEDQKTRKIKTT